MRGKYLAAAVLAVLSPLVHAALVTAEFGVNLTQVYNLETQSLEPIAPITAIGSFDVSSDAALSVTQDGNTTRTSVVNETGEYRPDLRYTSPLPVDLPYSFSDYFLFPGPLFGFDAFTSDLATGFVEGVEFWVVYDGPPLDHGVPAPHYAFDVSITRQTAARRGDGSSGYAFTSDRLVSFLEAAQQEGLAVHYNEGWSDSRSIGDYPYPVGTQGQQYADDAARIVGIKIDGVTQAVPEPSTWALMVVGGAALGLVRRRKR